MGLGHRARQLVIGVEAVRAALQGNRVQCVVLARDASSRARDKIVRLAEARGVPMLVGPGADAMGRRLGKPPVMVVGVRDRALADGLLRSAPDAVEGGLSGQNEST